MQSQKGGIVHTQDVALVRGGGLGGDGGLPVGLVHEHGAEVAHQVDDAENEAALQVEARTLSATCTRSVCVAGMAYSIVSDRFASKLLARTRLNMVRYSPFRLLGTGLMAANACRLSHTCR